MRFPPGAAGRWLVPVLVCSAVAGGVTLPPLLRSKPAPAVTPKSLEAVDADLLLRQDVSHSGTLVTTANLGLPDLPTRSLGGLSSIATLLTGTHTLRLWQSGADRQRLAILDTLAETDIVRTGAVLATYDSRQDAAGRLAVPGALRTRGGTSNSSAPLTPLLTPGAATDVRFGDPVRVAGRSAYSLVLTPRQSGTLVDHLTVAVDAEHGTVLRVRCYAKGYGAPAFEVAYRGIDFHTPPSRLFDLVPHQAVGTTAPPTVAARTLPTRANGNSAGIGTTGTGWATIFRIPLGQTASALTGSLDRLTVPVPEGRLLQTHLFSALLTPAGTLWIGAVPAAAVEKAARA